MKRAVIVGGGYAGIYALKELVKDKSLHITLVDKHTYHNLQPEVYDLIANKSNVADVTIDLSTLCAGINHPNLYFENLRVTGIDFDARRLHTAEEREVAYDYLILAVGSRTCFPKQVEGLNNTDDLKKLHRAIHFKHSFETDIFDKISDECKQCDNTHIAVVGAGLSGVEIAAEMAHYANRFFKRGLFACNSMRISLISGSKTILPGLDQKLIDMSSARLERLGVNVITDSHMTRVDDRCLYLDNGEKLPYSFIIFAGGIEAANLTSNLKLEKNKKGQLEVDSALRVNGYDNVFAAGDVAQIRDEAGKLLPPNVTVARASGIIAAKNLLLAMEGTPPAPAIRNWKERLSP